jgi:hypothetical protein
MIDNYLCNKNNYHINFIKGILLIYFCFSDKDVQRRKKIEFISGFEKLNLKWSVYCITIVFLIHFYNPTL